MIHRSTRNEMAASAIPIAGPLRRWETVSIRECGERLVSLINLAHPKVIAVPGYRLRGLRNAIDDCYVREGVAKRLANASKNLPRGFRFCVFDGWRPYELQQELYDEFRSRLVQENPELPADELDKLTMRYVSAPSRNPLRPSPHLTGGAVDLTIQGADGEYLDMGTEWDAFLPHACTSHYEKRGKLYSLSDQDTKRRDNRRLLFHALSNAGFTNYPEEWWHFDYGNQFWGRIKGSNAIYGEQELL